MTTILYKTKIKQLIGQRIADTGQMVTMSDVSRETKINRTTLHALANNGRHYPPSAEQSVALMKFFGIATTDFDELFYIDMQNDEGVADHEREKEGAHSSV